VSAADRLDSLFADAKCYRARARARERLGAEADPAVIIYDLLHSSPFQSEVDAIRERAWAYLRSVA